MSRSLVAVVAVLFAAAGCPADDDYPIRGGPGGPPGNGQGGDGGVGGPDGGAGALRSKVCVVTDLRQSQSCSPSNNVGVVVREQGTRNQATTIAGGFFDLTVTAKDVAILEVGAGSTTLVPSIVAIDVKTPPETIPVPAAAEHTALLSALEPVTPDGTGTIAAYYLDGDDRAFAGVVVQVPDGAANAPWYDVAGNAAVPWTSDVGTGPYGAVLLFGVPAGAASLAAAGPDQENLGLSGIPVVDGHVTFVTSRPTQ